MSDDATRSRPRRKAARCIAACAVVAALGGACGTAAPQRDAARADDGHFPERMPMVTYYDPMIEGPLGPTIQEGAIEQEQFGHDEPA
ncbi:MAG TPA: hypothetical protein VIL20_25370 [Sandaracinaceae bacterium]